MVPDEEAKPIEAAPEPTDLFQIVDNTTPVPEPSEPIEPSPIIPISDIGVIKVNVAPVIDPGTLIDEPVIFASQMPTFPGGEAAMMKFIQENVNYPSLAIENLIQGRVTVLFIIEKDGSISNVEVVRSLGWGLDTEAIRVVKSMPKWIPGENNFRPVRVKIALPIKFVLG